MDIEWLEDFLVLSDLFSLTRAAQARNGTHSAFSRRIRSLEEWIGTPLVDRDAMPPRLTMAGHLFRDAAREMVRQLHDTRVAFGHLSKAFAGIKLYAAYLLTQRLLPQCINHVNQRISGLQFEILEGETYKGLVALSGGRCDQLMVYHTPLVPMAVDERATPSIVLGTDRVVPVCKADDDGEAIYLLSEARLRNLPLLSYPPETFFGRLSNSLSRFRPSETYFDVAAQSPHPRILQSLACIGLGIAWLPEQLVREDLDAGRLALTGDSEWSTAVEIRLYASHERSRLLQAGPWEHIKEAVEVRAAVGT
jgi:DNA-binding transcriptional LysR family regulator